MGGRENALWLVSTDLSPQKKSSDTMEYGEPSLRYSKRIGAYIFLVALLVLAIAFFSLAAVTASEATPVQSITYHGGDGNADVTVDYYGIAATEYNPEVWNNTGYVGDKPNWVGPDGDQVTVSGAEIGTVTIMTNNVNNQTYTIRFPATHSIQTANAISGANNLSISGDKHSITYKATSTTSKIELTFSDITITPKKVFAGWLDPSGNLILPGDVVGKNVTSLTAKWINPDVFVLCQDFFNWTFIKDSKNTSLVTTETSVVSPYAYIGFTYKDTGGKDGKMGVLTFNAYQDYGGGKYYQTVQNDLGYGYAVKYKEVIRGDGRTDSDMFGTIYYLTEERTNSHVFYASIGGNPSTYPKAITAGTYRTPETDNAQKPTVNINNSGSTCAFLSGNVIFDNICLESSKPAKQGDSTDAGLFANGHILIMGTGITNPKITSSMDSGVMKVTAGAPVIFGGSTSNITTPIDIPGSDTDKKTIVFGDGRESKDGYTPLEVKLGTYVIVHSGIYSSIIAGSFGGVSIGTEQNKLSTYLVLKGGYTADTVAGGNGGYSGKIYGGTSTDGENTGGTFVYLIDHFTSGDNWEDKKIIESDSIRASYNVGQSSIIEGGCSAGTKTNYAHVYGSTHLFLSGTSSAWDVQAGGRNSGTVADQTYLEITGKATVRHAACGTITDGAAGFGNDCVGSVKIYVGDDAVVASLYGAGYDTTFYPYYKTMLDGVIEVQVSGGKIGQVFGGGYRGSVGDEGDPSKLQIYITIDGGEVFDSVYGGGSGGIDKIKHNADGTFQKSMDAYVMSQGRSYVYGDIYVTITGDAVIHGSVYGGGMSVPRLNSYSAGGKTVSFVDETVDEKSGNSTKKVPNYVASVFGNTTVYVKEDAVIEGSVYGAGRGIECTYNDYTWNVGDYTKCIVVDVTKIDTDNPFTSQPWFTDSSGHYEYSYTTTGNYLTSEGAKVTGGYYTNYAKVTGNTKVYIEGGTIWNNVYGGGAQGKVTGSTIVEMQGGEVKGNVFGGGLGSEDIVSVTGSRSVYIGSRGDRKSVIGGAVYGGSSFGDDGLEDSFKNNAPGYNADSIVVIDQAELGGSVFGGGFKGELWGDTYVYIGHTFTQTGPRSYSIEFYDGNENKPIKISSIYAGGNVSTSEDDDDTTITPFSSSLVKGDGTIVIYGNGAKGNIAISGSVMGSGNSCLTDGTTHIEILQLINKSKMTGIHRADSVLITQSTLDITGRSTVTSNYIASFYDIGELTLKYDTTVKIQYPADRIAKMNSLNKDSNPTTPGSPSNSLIFTGGSTFSVRNDEGTPGLVSGNIAIANQGQSDYGAYITGSTNSSGGFVISKAGSFKPAEMTDFDVTKRCWFIGGTEKRTTTLTMNASTDESVVKADATVEILKMSGNTWLEYIGGTFTLQGAENYTFIKPTDVVAGNPENTSSNNFTKYGLTLGTPIGNTNSGLIAKTDGVTNTVNIDNIVYPYFREGNNSPITFTPGGSNDKGSAGSYTLNLQLTGAPRNIPSYLGYITLNFHEVQVVTTDDDKTYRMTSNNIEIRVDVYVLPNEGSTSIGQNYDVTIRTENEGNNKHSGYIDVLFPNPGSIKDLSIVSVGKTGGQGLVNTIPSNATVRISAVMNHDNTTGWMSTRSVTLTSAPFSEQTIGTLSGTSVATLRYYIEYSGNGPGDITLNFKLTGDIESQITLHTEDKGKVKVTLNDVRNHAGTIPIELYYGSQLSGTEDYESVIGFVGWYYDPAYKTPFNADSPITADINLYARYMYTVTLDNMDGTTSKLYLSQEAGGTKIDKALLPTLTKKGYTFEGWYRDANFVYKWDPSYHTVTEDITLYAKLVGYEYKIVFMYGNNVRFDSDTTDGYVDYVMKIAKEVSGVQVVDVPVYPTVRVGSTFEIVDTAHDNMNVLSYAQSRVMDILGENQKFIRWQIIMDDSSTKAIYSDSVLTVDMVNTDPDVQNREVILYALTSSVAIKVDMDKNTSDAAATVTAPSTFYVFPDDYAGSSYVDRIDDNKSGYYYRDRNYLVEFEDKILQNNEEITVTHYRDIYGNIWSKSGNSYELYSSNVYYMDGSVENNKTCLTESDYPTSFYYKDKYGNKYTISGNAGNKPISPINDYYICMAGYSNTYYSFTYTLNDASRPGYRLINWDNDDIDDPLHPRPGAERTVKIFFTVVNGQILITKGVIEALDSDGVNVVHQFANYHDGNGPRLDDRTHDYTITYKAVWEQLTYNVTVSPTVNGHADAFLVDSNGVRTHMTTSTFEAHYGDHVEISYSSSNYYEFNRWITTGDCVLDNAYSQSTFFMVTGDCTVAASDLGDRTVNIVMIIDGNEITESELAKTTVLLKKISDSSDGSSNTVTGKQYFTMGFIEKGPNGAVFSNIVPLGTYNVVLRYNGDDGYEYPDCTLLGDLKINNNDTTTFTFYAISAIIEDEIRADSATLDAINTMLLQGNKRIASTADKPIVSYTKYVGALENLIFGQSHELIINNPDGGLPPVEVEIASGYDYMIFEGFETDSILRVVPGNYYPDQHSTSGANGKAYFHLNWTEFDEPASIIIQAQKHEYTVTYHIIGGDSKSTTMVYGDRFLNKVPNTLVIPAGYYLSGWYFNENCTGPMILGKDVLDDTNYNSLNLYSRMAEGTVQNVGINIMIEDLPPNTGHYTQYGTIVMPLLDTGENYSAAVVIVSQVGCTFTGVISNNDKVTVGSVVNGRVTITAAYDAFGGPMPTLQYTYARNVTTIQVTNSANQIYSGAWEPSMKAYYGQKIPMPIMRQNENGDSINGWTIAGMTATQVSKRIINEDGVYYYLVNAEDSDATLSFTATYPPKSYSVTFITPTGTFDANNQQRYSASISGSVQQPAFKEGSYNPDIYTFQGFYDGETKVSFPVSITTDKTLVAKWNVLTYQLSYSSDDYSNVSLASTRSASQGSYSLEYHTEVVLNIGLTAGHDLDVAETLKQSGITDSTKIKAMGNPVKTADNRYTWTFFVEDACNSGTAVNMKIMTKPSSASINFIVNGNVDYEVPVYDGETKISSSNIPLYTVVTFRDYSGSTTPWYTASDMKTLAPNVIKGTYREYTITVKEDISFYTVSNSYHVYYYGMDGTEELYVDTVTVTNNTFTLKNVNYSRDGYIFVGWAVMNDSNKVYTYKPGDTVTVNAYTPARIDLYAFCLKDGNTGEILENTAVSDRSSTISVPVNHNWGSFTTEIRYSASTPLDSTNYQTQGNTNAITFNPVGNHTVYYYGAIKKNDVTYHSFSGSFVVKIVAKNLVKFMSGEEAYQQVRVSDGGKVAKPEDPLREGYAFDGWFLGEVTDPFDFATATISSDTTLTAKWTKLYTVTFNSDGGTAVETQYIRAGKCATEPTAPTKSSVSGYEYTFDGWMRPTQSGSVKHVFTTDEINSDVVLTAKWITQRISYTIEYYGTPDNSEPQIQDVFQVYHGDTTFAPAGKPEPVPGLTFEGWYEFVFTKDGYTISDEKFNFNQAITADHKLITRWLIHNYNITFDANGGQKTEGNNVVAQAHGPAVKISEVVTASWAGHTLLGWSQSPTGDVQYTATISGPMLSSYGAETYAENGASITLYAIWREDVHTVSFDTDGGSAVTSQPVDHGQKATAPQDPTKDATSTNGGYRFLGWYLGDETEPFDFDAPINSSITLKAKWMEQFIVRFLVIDNEQETVFQSVLVDKGTAVSAPITNPTLGSPGQYTFRGWQKVSDGLGYNFSSPVNANLDLKASWSENDRYTISFYSLVGGNTLNMEGFVQVYVNQKINPADMENKVPDLPGLTFVGWYVFDGEDYSVINGPNAQEFDPNLPVTSDIYVVTKWETHRYNITFNGNAENVIGLPGNTVSLALGPSTAIDNSEIKRTGYRFVGWSLSENGPVAYTDSISGVITTGTPTDNRSVFNVTFYAIWSDKYTVTFDTDGGTVIDPIKVTVGQAPDIPVTTKQKYELDGWYFANDAKYDLVTPINENVTLTAKWIRLYTVTFNPENGQSTTSVEVRSGSKIIEPQQPTRTSSTTYTYTFGGWYKGDESRYDFEHDVITADITLHAHWENEMRVYVVEYYGTPGNASPVYMEKAEVYYNDLVTAPVGKPDPVNGLTFLGWYEFEFTATGYEVSETPFDFTKGITESHKLITVWQPHLYNIRFNSNGGSGSIPDYERITPFAVNLPIANSNLSRTGYTLVGWTLSPEISEIKFTDKITEPLTYDDGVTITLYAKWNINSYTVKFNPNNGETIQDQTITHGNLINKTLVTVNVTEQVQGKRFLGWYYNNNPFDIEHTPITSNITLEGRWIQQYTVTFNPDNGSDSYQVKVDDGSLVTEPSRPSKGVPGEYRFTGWWNPITDRLFDFTKPVTSDLSLTGIWMENNQYTISFYSNTGGTSLERQGFVQVYEGQTVPSQDFNKVPSIPGLTFLGWYEFNGQYASSVSTTAFNQSQPITHDVYLMPKWQTHQYNITFDPNATDVTGMPANTTSLAHGAPTIVNISSIARAGWHFIGWSLSENGPVKFKNTISGPITDGTPTDNPSVFNVTLYAVWSANYTVTFDSDNGSDPTQQLVLVSSPTVNAPSTPVKENYAFDGWFIVTVDQQGEEHMASEAFDFNTQINDDMTLKAKWTRLYTVTFNSAGGTEVSSQTVRDGGKAIKPADPTRESTSASSYTFLGWYKDDIPFDFTDAITGDTILTAKWNANDALTVEFYDWPNTGTPVLRETAAIYNGDKVTAPVGIPSPLEGYTFLGWYVFDGTDTSNLVTKFDFNDAVTTNTKLVTKWMANVYHVTFNKNTDDAVSNVPANNNYTYGDSIGSTSGLLRDGYRFLGWALSADGDVVYTNSVSRAISSATATSTVGEYNVTLYAKWIQQFTVRFYQADGTTEYSEYATTVDAGSAVAKPNDPTTGEPGQYTFQGWLKLDGWVYSFNTPVTGDLKLKASWSENNKWTVSFYSLEGGTNLKREGYIQVYDGQSMDQSEIRSPPNVSGLTFVGWYEFDGSNTSMINDPGAVEFTLTQPITRNVNLLVKWISHTYNITFDANAGSDTVTGIPSNVTAMAHGKPGIVDNSHITRSGYSFAGWSLTNNGEVAFTDMISGPITVTPSEYRQTQFDVTLYAVWLKIHTVTFMDDATEYEVQYVDNGGKATIPLTSPTKDSTVDDDGTTHEYTFAGWFVDLQSSNSYDFGTAVSADLILHAKWADDMHHVVSYYSMYNNTPSPRQSMLVEHGSYIAQPDDPPAQKGLRFVGWFAFDGVNASSMGDTAFNFSSPIVSSVKLAPKWIPNEFTVRFNLNTSMIAEADRVNVTGSVNNIYGMNCFRTNVSFDDSSVECTGYRLVGWDLSPTGNSCEFKNHKIDRALYYDDGAIVNLYAIWSDSCDVEFDADGGSNGGIQKVRIGSSAEPVNTLKTGYRFLGWYLVTVDEEGEHIEEDTFDFNTVITKDIKLMAKWFKLCAVSFDSNGGSRVSTQYLEPGSNAIKPVDPVRDGYDFDYWSVSGQGTAYDFTSTVTGDLVLVAHWTAVDDPEDDPYTPPSDNTTRETEVIENEDGSTTTKETVIINGRDGSITETVTETTVNTDGSTETKEEYSYKDPKGNVTERSSKTTVYVDEYGNTIEKTLNETSSPDGSKRSEDLTVVTNADGDVTEKDITLIDTDSQGKEGVIRIIGDANGVEATLPSTEMDILQEVKDLISDMPSDNVTLAFDTDDGSVIIPSEYLKEASESSYSLSLNNNAQTVTLDKDVISNLSEKEDDAVLSIARIYSHSMTEVQKEIIGDNYAMSLSISVGTETVSSLGGSANVKVKSDIPYDHVYYVADDGTIEEIPCVYDAETKTLSFVLEHFSIYTLTVGPLDNGTAVKDQTMTLILIFAIVVVISATVLVIGSRKI